MNRSITIRTLCIIASITLASPLVCMEYKNTRKRQDIKEKKHKLEQIVKKMKKEASSIQNDFYYFDEKVNTDITISEKIKRLNNRLKTSDNNLNIFYKKIDTKIDNNSKTNLYNEKNYDNDKSIWDLKFNLKTDNPIFGLTKIKSTVESELENNEILTSHIKKFQKLTVIISSIKNQKEGLDTIDKISESAHLDDLPSCCINTLYNFVINKGRSLKKPNNQFSEIKSTTKTEKYPNPIKPVQLDPSKKATISLKEMNFNRRVNSEQKLKNLKQ